MSAHQETNEFARWEARFATPDYAFGKEPNYFLKSCQQILPRRGRALAVADGEGEDRDAEIRMSESDHGRGRTTERR